MTTANLSETTLDFSLNEQARAALFTQARSAIVFEEREVPLEAITRAWDLAKWGPSSNNTQPLRVVAATSDAARQAVIDAAAAFNKPKFVQAPLLLVAAHDDRFHDLFDIWAGGSASAFERFESNPEMRSSIASSGAMLQLGYFILALRAEGLALRPYGGFDRGELDASLMPDNWHAHVVMGVGYPTTSEDDGSGERRGRIPSEIGIRAL